MSDEEIIGVITALIMIILMCFSFIVEDLTYKIFIIIVMFIVFTCYIIRRLEEF